MRSMAWRSERPDAPAVPLCQPAARASGGGDRARPSARSPTGAPARSASACLRRIAAANRIPATSTIHAVLDRHGLVKRMRQRPRTRTEGTPLSEGLARTICGAPTTRVSSCSATAATATRSPSPITPRAICCCARPWNPIAEQPAFTAFERALQGARFAGGHPLRQRRSVRLPQRTVQPLEAVGVVAAARHPASSASSLAIRSKTAGMSACT